MKKCLIPISVFSATLGFACVANAQSGPTVYEISALSSPLPGTSYIAQTGGGCPVSVASYAAGPVNMTNPVLTLGHQVIFIASSAWSGNVTYSMSIVAYKTDSDIGMNIVQPFSLPSNDTNNGSASITLAAGQAQAYPANLSATANYACPAPPSLSCRAVANTSGTYSGGPTAPGSSKASFTVNPPE